MNRRQYLATACAAGAAVLAGCSGGGPDGGGSGSPTATPTATPADVVAEVRYDGTWQGTLEAGGYDPKERSIEGSGNRTFDVTDDIVRLNLRVQKRDDTSRQLTIRALAGGSVIAESSTTEGYGWAEIEHIFQGRS